MKKATALLTLLITIIAFSAFNLNRKTSINPATKVGSQGDSIIADRKHYVDELRLAIKGKEDLPADAVFKNVKILKNVPSASFISIMDIGYGAALGVTCGYCHKNEEWELDIKQTKVIARKMAIMDTTINRHLLKSIDGLKGPNSIVTCNSCHRGEIKPAL